MEESSRTIQWLWQTLDDFTNDERVLFLKFVSGRSRLPANIVDIPQKFQITKIDRVRSSNNRDIFADVFMNIL